MTIILKQRKDLNIFDVMVCNSEGVVPYVMDISQTFSIFVEYMRQNPLPTIILIDAYDNITILTEHNGINT